MGLILNRRREMGGGEVLPYDAQIEYIQGVGTTDCIDTGYAFINNNVVIKCRLATNSTSGYNRLFGSVGGTNYGLYFVARSSGVCNVGAGNSTFNIGTIQFDVPQSVQIQANSGAYTLSVDGSSASDAYNGSVVNGASFQLFKLGPTDTPSSNTIKFYSLQIYDGGVLKRDMIPVRKGNVGYMYDRVSMQLFGDSGTGSFVLGPDV